MTAAQKEFRPISVVRNLLMEVYGRYAQDLEAKVYIVFFMNVVFVYTYFKHLCLKNGSI